MGLQGSVAPNWRNTSNSQIPHLVEEPGKELEGGKKGRDLQSTY